MREMFSDVITKEQSATPISGMGDDAFIPGSQMTEIGLGGGVVGDAPSLGEVRASELGLGRGLTGKAAERPYLPHVLAPAGLKDLKKRAKKTHGGMESMRDAWRQMPNAFRRHVPGTVEDAKIRFGKDYFLGDVPTIKAVRLAAHETSMASRDFLKETAEAITVKPPDGKSIVIPLAEIAKRTTPISGMPNMGLILKPTEIRDIMAYLMTLE